MLQQIRFTSKAALKQQAIFLAGGNPREAKEFYDFLIDGMETLPDLDPIPPTWQENTKDTVNGILSWLKENQDTLATGISYVRSVFKKTPPPPPATPLPTIN